MDGVVREVVGSRRDEEWIEEVLDDGLGEILDSDEIKWLEEKLERAVGPVLTRGVNREQRLALLTKTAIVMGAWNLVEEAYFVGQRILHETGKYPLFLAVIEAEMVRRCGRCQ